MPINAHPEYIQAEKEYNNANTDEEKLAALEQMTRTMPKHKSAEAFRKNIRTRYKKLKQDIEKKSRKKSKGKPGIKKEQLQAILIGLTNSGKSSILKALTNAQPKIASYGFTTNEPEIGTLNYENCNIQLIDLPPIASETFDKGILNNADTILIVIEKIHEIKPILDLIKQNKNAKKIIIFNKIDLHDENTKRKIKETLRSKKYNFAIISTKTDEGLENLREKIFNSFPIIRVYTKHPGKRADNHPVVLQKKATLKNVAEKILHGYSKKVKYAKITGPSSKFKNQKIGLSHVVKDKDIVEFITD
jgi:ribosome-interacting GTPase 1